MAFEVASLLISALSALSSLVQAYKAARDEAREVRKSRIRGVTKRAETPVQIGGKAVENVINRRVLRAILKDIRQSLDRLTQVLSDSTISNQTKDEETAAAESRICGALKRIKRLNNGRLPTKRLEKMWISHSCDRQGG